MLLGAAAESELRGDRLLGEMPRMFAQLPLPKSSLAVLETFTTLVGIEIDFSELREILGHWADVPSSVVLFLAVWPATTFASSIVRERG